MEVDRRRWREVVELLLVVPMVSEELGSPIRSRKIVVIRLLSALRVLSVAECVRGCGCGCVLRASVVGRGEILTERFIGMMKDK